MKRFGAPPPWRNGTLNLDNNGVSRAILSCRALYSLNQDTSDDLSLVALFSNKNTKVHESIKGLQGSARLIAMTSIYVEEKRLLRETQSWLFSRVRDSVASEYQENTPTSNPVRSRRPLDQEFELFKDQPGPGIERTALATTHMKTYHLLSILRRVPPRTLFMYFGWMTTAQGADTATKELRRLLTEDKRSAREALQHSAILFRTIRNQSTATFFDPLSLLIAALYMRVYVQLEDISLRETFATLQTSSWMGKPLRIDQMFDDDTSNSWTEIGAPAPLHITGIGLLDGVESGSRILKETIRVLTRRMQWNGLSSGVVRTLQQLLNGELPNLNT